MGMPPVEQSFEANGAEYLAFLDAATAAAEKFAKATAADAAAIKALREQLDGLAAAETAAAGAGQRVADAEDAAASASARAAAGAREAAGAQRDAAASAAGMAASEDAAAEAAAKMSRQAVVAAAAADKNAKALLSEAGAAALAARTEATLNARLRAGFAAEQTAARGADQLKDTLEALAFVEQVVDEDTARLTQGWFDAAIAANRAAEAEQRVAEQAAAAAEASRTLASAQRTAATMAAGLTAAQRQVRDALDAVALAEGIAATEAERLTRAETAGSLAAAQDAEMARALAEADAALAASQAAAAEAARLQGSADMYLGAVMSDAERDALGLTAATAASAAASTAAGAAAARAGTGVRIWGTGIRLAGVNWLTLVHWIVAGSAEFLAVFIPAMTALGAGLLVAMQGAQNASRHMTALYDTMEAVGPVMGKTAGDVLGLGHSLQAAQDAANPGVYELLGSAINDAKTHFADLAGAGLQTVHMFDAFAARVTLDLQGKVGAQLHGFLTGMVTDLQRFGQVLGNLGRSIMNLASAMPGLANVLLAGLAGFTGLLRIVTSLPAPIITVVMALEEFYRWGGVVISLLARMTGQFAAMNAIAGDGGFITRFGAGLVALTSAGGRALIWAGQMVGRLAGMSAIAGRAGTALASAGASAATFAESMGPAGMAGIAGAAVALIGLVYWLGQSKSATDQFVASTDKAVQSASNLRVFSVISNTMAQNAIRMAAATEVSTTATTRFNQAAQQGKYAAAAYAGSAMMAEGAVTKLADQQQFLNTTAHTVLTNAGSLARTFRTDLTGALGLATAAGVNLQQSWAKGGLGMQIAIQQVRNLVQGLGAMSAPMGMIGADVEAMGIQSQLAATKVQQLNQAWDAWMQSVTAGVNAMSQVQTALHGMAAASAASGASMAGTLGHVTFATNGTTYSLKGLGQTAMQSWQQFTGAVQSGQSALDALRTGMAEGVVTGGQFTRTVKGLVGEMAPFTQGNRTAVSILSQLAHQAGGPTTSSLKELEKWAGVSGKTARNQFTSGMLAATRAMSNMSKVAQNLSAVVGQQLDSAMAASINKSSGLDAALAQYAKDLAGAHTPASRLAADQQAIAGAMSRADRMTGQAAQGLNRAAREADRAATSARNAGTQTDSMGQSANKAGTKLDGMGVAVSRVIAHVSRMGTAGQQAGTSLAHGVDTSKPRAVSAAQSMVQAMHAKVAAMTSQFHAAGANASAGLAAGITAGAGAAVSAAQNLVNQVNSTLSGVKGLNVHSPSKLWRQYGFWAVQGLITGLTDGGPKLMAAVQNMVNSINRAFKGGSLTAAQDSSLVHWVKSDNAKLQALAAQRKALAAKIAAVTATDKALQSSFSSIIGLGHAPAPYTGKVPTAQQMVANLRTELADIKRFASDLKKLKALGLDNSIIQRIIAMGPMQGMAYAEALIQAAGQAKAGSGGKAGGGGTGPPTVGGPAGKKNLPPTVGGGTSSIIAQLNAAYEQIQSYSKQAGASVTKSMYGAGVAAAKGLVAGLKAQMHAIDAQMRKIAEALVKAIRRDLRSHSPSQVMHDEGLKVPMGIAAGIDAGGPLVAAAMKRMTGIIGGTRVYLPPMHQLHPAYGGSSGSAVMSPNGGRVPMIVGGVNPGGTMGGVTVHVEVHGHVVTDRQLLDFVRDGVQEYLHRNGRSDLTARYGRG